MEQSSIFTPFLSSWCFPIHGAGHVSQTEKRNPELAASPSKTGFRSSGQASALSPPCPRFISGSGKSLFSSFPGGSDGKQCACNAGDPGLIPGSGRYPEEGHDNPLQFSCLENRLDRGPWQTTVHVVTKIWI